MRIGVMCSGEGTNFENIVHSCHDHKVVLMIHNTTVCGAKFKAEKLGIRHLHIHSRNEDKIIKAFKDAKVDLIVMAGWMRIIGKDLIKAFENKIINIHPSLLPKYKGLNAVQQALDDPDEMLSATGCTVHYVTEELDSGAIIKQAIVPMTDYDDVESLTKRIRRSEHRILPEVINELLK